jgi:site-specific DNA-methyltransferase (adenine-specific)
MLYYQDEFVTLYHADSTVNFEWLKADVLLTDPPYGIDWTRPAWTASKPGGQTHTGIENDKNTKVRDYILELWGNKPWAVFGSPLFVAPNTKQVLVWQKPSNSGFFGTVAGFRRDWEAIFLGGNFGKSKATRSSVLKSSAGSINSYLNKSGHPHTKPVDLMEQIITEMPAGVLTDPFAGSGSTLVAAKKLGIKIIGFELEEKYCESIAKRLSQQSFDFKVS